MSHTRWIIIMMMLLSMVQSHIELPGVCIVRWFILYAATMINSGSLGLLVQLGFLRCLFGRCFRTCILVCHRFQAAGKVRTVRSCDYLSNKTPRLLLRMDLGTAMEDQIPLKWIPMFKPQLNKVDTSSTATTPATLLSPQVSSSSCARYHTSLWLRLRGSRPFLIPCQLRYHHGNRSRLSIDYLTRFLQQCYLTFQTSECRCSHILPHNNSSVIILHLSTLHNIDMHLSCL